MNVELLESCDHRAASIWRALEATNTSYFLSCSWIEHWLAAIPRTHAPIMAVFRDGDAAVAAGLFGRHANRAWFLHTTGDPRFDEVRIEHNALVGARISLAALVAALPDGWDELVLPAIDRDAFGPPLAEGVRVHVDMDLPAPFVDLQRVRETSGGYPGLLAPATRAHIRRTRRALGELTIEYATDSAHAFDIYAELVDLHRRAQPGAFADPWFESFHRGLILQHPGDVELVRVRARGRTVGCLYNLAYRGRVLAYQSGLAHFDDPKIKPGLVVHAAAIANAAARGDDTYDFLGGDGRYKHDLATGAVPLRWLCIQRGSTLCSRLTCFSSWSGQSRAM